MTLPWKKTKLSSRFGVHGDGESAVLPDLPAAAALMGTAYQLDEDLPATTAHRVMLYCALDAACIPVDPRDQRAIDAIAALDYATVNAVIRWLHGADPSTY